MPYSLSDIFIGNYPMTQGFGEHPQEYNARFGLRGHNGVDWACPTMTPVLVAAGGIIKEVAFDEGGYGKYIKVVHDGYLTLYAHLNDAVVKVNDKVVAGQLLGHSNNTGFSTNPHLHFGVAPCDALGNKTEGANGFSGYINPNGDRCAWKITNPQVPVVPSNTTQPDIPVKSNDFTLMVAEGTNYKVIRGYLLEHGLNEYLAKTQIGTLDIVNNPRDPEGGNKIVAYLAHLLDENEKLRKELEAKTGAIVPEDLNIILEQSVKDEQKKTAFLQTLLTGFKGFIFQKGGV
jgi:murein DD-endopeptidase MepM/ murein hydrolase activator NlpD